jgi:secreted PhoX family phosphatase
MAYRLSKKARLLSAIITASALAACSGDDGADGTAGAQGPQGEKGAQGDQGATGNNALDPVPMAAGLVRLGTVPLGAEVTGAFVTEGGDLFFNVQHPSDSNTQLDENGKTFHTGTVGVVTGVNVNRLPKNLISVPVPKTDLERETVQLAYGEYQVLGQTGDTFGGALPNGLGTVMALDDSTIAVESNMPDFNGYIATGENEGYLFTNWESIPGGMSRIKLQKDAASGLWSVDNNDVMMLDFGDWGTIANCFGSVTPWGTPLTSEEWGNSGDATHLWNKPEDARSQDSMAKYLDPTANNAGDASRFPNTYRYHYIVEITNPASAQPTPVKHYAMGRFEHENSIAMPDQRTVYLSQDSTNGVLYKFVADNPGDLTTGTLYAAKLTQDAGSFEPQTTGFDITWIELAHGNNAAIETWIAEYDAIGQDDYVEGKSSYLTDADAMAWAAGESTYPSYDTAYAPALDAGYEGATTFGGAVTAGQVMDDRVAFLESRKAARAKGATAEWRKFEGIYINQKRAEEAVDGTDLVPGETVTDAYVYFAIADMDNGMIDGEGDIRLSNRVKECGGVYRMPLMAGYDVNRIEPVLMGATYRSGVDDTEQCDVNGLAQPDNVIVLDDGRILIGEDGDQTNNTLWLYDPSVNN